jgi:hypothetical protein
MPSIKILIAASSILGKRMLKYVTSTLVRFVNPVLVETGTYTGEGVDVALSLGFERVISIELLEKFYVPAQEKFREDPRVILIHGDSALVLHDAIKNIGTRITFWLDGHSFPEQEHEHDQFGVKACPLIEELEQISRHPVKNHVIMIDDMSSLPAGGLYETTDFTREDVEAAVLRINPSYQIEYFDRGGTDVLLAYVRA